MDMHMHARLTCCFTNVNTNIIACGRVFTGNVSPRLNLTEIKLKFALPMSFRRSQPRAFVEPPKCGPCSGRCCRNEQRHYRPGTEPIRLCKVHSLSSCPSKILSRQADKA